jgi:hypothetical protein
MNRSESLAGSDPGCPHGGAKTVARELHGASRDQAVQQVLNIEHGVTEQLRHVGYHAGVT